MNTITSTAQHPDHGLGAVPSVDLTNGVDLTHQLALDRHAKFSFFSCHDLAVSALGGLIAARLGQKLVPAADGQDRSKGKEQHVSVTDCVERDSGADADEHDGHAIGLHGSGGLGFGKTANGDKKQMGMVQLHFGRDTACDPVLNPLHPARFVEAEKVGDFGRTPKGGDALGIGPDDFVGGVHRTILNTMFTVEVNTMFVNKPFSPRQSGMHESMKRLLDCAKAATKGKRNAILDFAGIEVWMTESKQVVNNWKRRGLSKDGALKAASLFNCDANWLLEGKGEIGTPHADERDDLSHALSVISRVVASSDHIAKLSLELLVAAIDRKPAESGTSARLEPSLPIGSEVKPDDADNQAAHGDNWSKGYQPPKSVKANNEQNLSVPSPKRSGE